MALLLALVPGLRWLLNSLNTASTDDAYVNGHVTFVAPRVAGQVARVLVDDNNRVHRGDLLVQLDPEPYQVQVDIAEAAVAAAQAEVVTVQAQARGTEGRMRSLRFNLDHAIEDVDNQIALLRARVAAWQERKASLAKEQALQRVLKQQATSLAYFDVFWSAGTLAMLLVCLVLLMRRSVAEKGAPIAAE